MYKGKGLHNNLSFSGWIIAASGSFLIFIIAGTTFYATSIYLVPLQGYFDSSRGAIAQAFALISLLNGLFLPLVGTLVDRWGPRKCLFFGFAGLTATFFLLSFITTLWQLYILVIIQGVFLPFSGGLPNQALIGRWFIRRRGRAMGLVSTGVGLGGLILPWIMGTITETHGFRPAFFITALMILFICIPVNFFLIKDSPSSLGQYPDGEKNPGRIKSQQKKRGLYLKHAVKLYPFYAVLICSAFAHGIVGLISMHLPALLQDTGLSLSTASAYLGITLGISVGGRLLVGELSDKIKPRILYTVSVGGMAVSVLLLFFPSIAIVRIIFVIFYGFFQGSVATVLPLLVHSLFGGRAFGRIYGLLLFASGGAVALGNFLSGHIYDSAGNYHYSILIALVLGLLSSLIVSGFRYKNENLY